MSDSIRVDILILGAGAAGLMAAVAAAESAREAGRTRRIFLVEKNRQAGIKVLVCGGGRGNLTNAGTRAELLASFGREGRGLVDALAHFDNEAVCEMFHRLGVATKVEADGRIFPRSDKARDLVDALVGRAAELGVQTLTGLAAVRLTVEGSDRQECLSHQAVEGSDGQEGPSHQAVEGSDGQEGPSHQATGPRIVGAVLVPADTPAPGRGDDKVPAKWRRFDKATWSHTRAQSTAAELEQADDRRIHVSARAVVLAVGGSSYTRMGTTGDGYRLCEELGIPIVKPRPAIVPLLTVEQWGERLAGVALPATVAIDLPKLRAKPSNGDLLFTHFGLSGPAALNISDQVALLLEQGQSPVPLKLDLLPDRPPDFLERRFTDVAAAQGKRSVRTILAEWIPERLAEHLLIVCGSSADVTAGQLPKAVRRALVDRLKAWKVGVHATKGMAQAMVTAGGVPLREVDPKTMQTRRVRGLYLAGEMLDVTGPSGGYNLQIAWSTGHLAGVCAERG